MLRLAARRTLGKLGRYPCSAAVSSGDSYAPRLGYSSPLGGVRARRRRSGSSSYLALCSAAWEAGGEGRRERIMAPQQPLELVGLDRGSPQKEGGKGQGKKGKAKGDKTGDADTKPRAADPSACWQGNDQAWQDGDLNKRWLHLEDSVVCLLILSKGRTSSHLLQPLCRQIGAVQLAAGSVLMLGM